jgi:hypothetical protein
MKRKFKQCWSTISPKYIDKMNNHLIYIFYSGNYKFLLILLQEGVHHDTFFSNYHTHAVYVNTLLHLRSKKIKVTIYIKNYIHVHVHTFWMNVNYIFDIHGEFNIIHVVHTFIVIFLIAMYMYMYVIFNIYCDFNFFPNCIFFVSLFKIMLKYQFLLYSICQV